MLEENGNYGELFMYVLAGCVAVAMFRDLKENTSIGFPVFISLVTQAVLLIAFNVLFLNRTLSINILILPILNLMLNLIILLIFLNMFGVYVIRKTNDRYMDINDPDYSLLANLKEKDKDEYFRAIHTGYLAERVAHELGLNSRAIKTCAYYHRIGIPENKTKWKDVEPLYTENDFPVEAVEYLHEYIAPKKGSARSKEALTVQICETVIASIMLLIKQNKNATINYDDLIEGIFKKKRESGELMDYDVTFKEFDTMRKILKREKLYYDFLR
jgi:membrane-associated HD superfamily phosphohydrolase